MIRILLFVCVGFVLNGMVDGGRLASRHPSGAVITNHIDVHRRSVMEEGKVGGKASSKHSLPPGGPFPSAAPVAVQPVNIVVWATPGWAPTLPVASPTTGTATPTTDNNRATRMERICQAASQGEPYPSNNHVLISYQYDVRQPAVTDSWSPSAIPDAVAVMLTSGYILRHCNIGRKKKHRVLLLQAGDVQSISAYQATLLLQKNSGNSTCDDAENCDSSTTRWNGTNRIYFRDDYDITAETEATILQDITVAFDSMDLLEQVQTTDVNIQALSFVTGSGATTAIVGMTKPEKNGNNDTASSNGTEIVSSRNGMKPVGKAFLSMGVLLILAVLLFIGYAAMKRQKTQQEAHKGLSHVHLGTSNTMQNEDEYLEEDSDGFVPFRPGKVRVSSEPRDVLSQSGFGTEAVLVEQSFQSSSTNRPTKNSSTTDLCHTPKDIGAEKKRTNNSFMSKSQSMSRVTPDTLPTNSEAKASIDNSYSSFSDLQVPVTSPRNYRVPDTLDL